MINLADDPLCDKWICNELNRAGIDVLVGDRSSGEVATIYTGALGPFRFRRAWYYWVAKGPMPLLSAEALYAHPEGKEAVRVMGHCCCIPPKEWITWRTPDGREVLPLAEIAQFKATKIPREYVFADDPREIGASPFVECYHIDTQAGLNLFAQTIRDGGLAYALHGAGIHPDCDARPLGA